MNNTIKNQAAPLVPAAPATIRLDYSKITDVQVDGINRRDAPDFVDAFIASASYEGREMTDDELDILNQDSQYVYECVIDELY